MDSDLKTRLLEKVGALADSNNGRRRNASDRNSQNESGDTSGAKARRSFVPRRSSTMSEDQIVRVLSSKKKLHGEGNPRLRRQFIQRLAVALHSYGSSSARTEYLIEKAACKLDLDVAVAVFPSLIVLSFPECKEEDGIQVLKVEGGLDVDKLGRVDHLANNVGMTDTPLLLAYWRLKAIATSPVVFGRWWWRLFGYSLSSSMSALLFFKGSLWDGLVCLGLGLIVGIFEMMAESSPLFNSVQEFVSALVISALARISSLYLGDLKLCFLPMVLASLTQLLPGLPLTVGVSEMVARAHVTGTSRIMYALFAALQLGFGIAVGENLVFWAPHLADITCEAANISIWWSPLWFILFSVASTIVLSARLDQWPGMIVTSGVGYIVATIAGQRLASSASSVVAAFAVGITGTLYSKIAGDLPLIRVLSGIRLLVPGGIGVQGVAALLDDDVLSGMGFVFDMIVVGLSITIGLLLAKLVLPAGLFGVGRTKTNNKSTLAAQLEDDEASEPESDEESSEHMAI